MALLYRGAEAEIRSVSFLGFPAVEKLRVQKKYRAPLIDNKIRAERVKREASMLVQARAAVNTPRVYDVNLENKSITMELVTGTKVRDLPVRKIVKLAPKIGIAVKRLHDLGIVHADLTTSNIILNGKSLAFIDFGLAFKSKQTEDRAVDLVVFKKMLKSTHFSCFDAAWAGFLAGYKPNRSLLAKIDEIEKRARYSER